MWFIAFTAVCIVQPIVQLGSDCIQRSSSGQHSPFSAQEGAVCPSQNGLHRDWESFQQSIVTLMIIICLCLNARLFWDWGIHCLFLLIPTVGSEQRNTYCNLWEQESKSVHACPVCNLDHETLCKWFSFWRCRKAFTIMWLGFAC